MVFAAGHPGRTERMLTLAQIEYQRDFYLPNTIKSLNRQLVVLLQYAALGEEQKHRVNEDIFGTQVGIKLLTGWLRGLEDKNVFAKKQQEESEFRALIKAKPDLQKAFGETWDLIETAKKKQSEQFKYSTYRQLNNARLSNIAVNIALYVSETKLPETQRINGFRDSQLESMKRRIFTNEILSPNLQEALLTDNLQESLEELGANDEFVKTVLQNHPPAEAAKELVANTKLFDINFRKTLIEGGAAAVNSSNDSLIVLARKIAPLIRENRKFIEENVENVEAVNAEKIGKAKFAVFGKSNYPDASQSLRLSFGTVKSYLTNGTIAPVKTTFYGLFDRSLGFDGKFPFNLPTRFSERKDRLNLTAPMNFISNPRHYRRQFRFPGG